MLRPRKNIMAAPPPKITLSRIPSATQARKIRKLSNFRNANHLTKNTGKKIKGRPPKHYHPLLQKEKHLESVVRRILPKQVADKVCTKGSRLAHLYGLPKTHKPQLAMRPILSAQGTYNYALAKWLDEKLKNQQSPTSSPFPRI